MENLKASLKFGGILSEASIQQVLEKFVERTLKAGEHFLDFGKVAHEIMFVSHGFLRNYDLSRKGEEVTKYIVRPNQFYSDLESYYNLSPCENAIQAVTEASIYVINRSAWDSLGASIPNFYLYTKALIEAALLNKIKDNDFLNYGTAMDKYLELHRRYPEIVLSVPQQYVASYLKITPQSLSRIRKHLADTESA